MGKMSVIIMTIFARTKIVVEKPQIKFMIVLSCLFLLMISGVKKMDKDIKY